MRGCSKEKVKEKKMWKERECFIRHFTKRMAAYELRIDVRRIFTCFEVADEHEIKKRNHILTANLCSHFSVRLGN
jgi:hypothetical protein